MLVLLLAVIAGFLTSLLLTPLAMEFLVSSGIIGIDQQKKERPQLPTSGGIAVMFGFLVALSVFLGFETFLNGNGIATASVLASLCSVTIIALIGLIDDIHVKHDGREVKGATQVSVGFAHWWTKPILVVPASLPLMVIKAGQSTMHLPIIGAVDFGVVYPLVLVPLGVICVSNATNMLAGHNGMEAGMGAVALTSLGVFAYMNGSVEAAAVALGMAASLLGFLFYNFYPAKILPGDSLTYAIGAAFIAAAVVANVERFAVIIFIPWIIEAFLKVRSGFQASSLGTLQDDGSLKPPSDEIHSLTHVFMRWFGTERNVVIAAIVLETVLCITAFILYV